MGNTTPFNGYTYNYGYDANGSLFTETNAANGGEITAYNYDSRNRLVSWQRQAKGVPLANSTFSYNEVNTCTALSYVGKIINYLQNRG